MTHKKIGIKTISIIATLTLVAAAVFCLTACNGGEDSKTNAESSISIYIDETLFSVKTDKTDVFGVLSAMKNYAAISAFTYTASTVGNDKFVSTLHFLAPNPANEYVAVYHTVNDITLKGTDYITGEFLEKQKFDKTFYYSGVGIGLLPVKDGASYWFVIEQF